MCKLMQKKISLINVSLANIFPRKSRVQKEICSVVVHGKLHSPNRCLQYTYFIAKNESSRDFHSCHGRKPKFGKVKAYLILFFELLCRLRRCCICQENKPTAIANDWLCATDCSQWLQIMIRWDQTSYIYAAIVGMQYFSFSYWHLKNSIPWWNHK